MYLAAVVWRSFTLAGLSFSFLSYSRAGCAAAGGSVTHSFTFFHGSVRLKLSLSHTSSGWWTIFSSPVDSSSSCAQPKFIQCTLRNRIGSPFWSLAAILYFFSKYVFQSDKSSCSISRTIKGLFRFASLTIFDQSRGTFTSADSLLYFAEVRVILEECVASHQVFVVHDFVHPSVVKLGVKEQYSFVFILATTPVRVTDQWPVLKRKQKIISFATNLTSSLLCK